MSMYKGVIPSFALRLKSSHIMSVMTWFSFWAKLFILTYYFYELEKSCLEKSKVAIKQET